MSTSDSLTSPVRIVGVDCAVKSAKTGIAAGVFRRSHVELTEVLEPSSSRGSASQIAALLKGSERALIALDAPLGWPIGLRAALQDHVAGEHLKFDADDMFRRCTDRCVHDRLGRRPLDVGADRIARTAHAALKLLHDLRTELGQEIPLAWDPRFSATIAAIEVYPAATLSALGIDPRSCRNTKRRLTKQTIEARQGLLAVLRRELVVHLTDEEFLRKSPDACDAAICVLAGADFLRELCEKPKDPEVARIEGWIWVRGSAKSAKKELGPC